MTQSPRRFTKEFKDEAVRLALTSGRTRREIASDLGVGRSTLALWISRSRNRPADPGDGQAVSSMITELKQLRHENELLRQERDALKRITTFYVR